MTSSPGLGFSSIEGAAMPSDTSFSRKGLAVAEKATEGIKLVFTIIGTSVAVSTLLILAHKTFILPSVKQEMRAEVAAEINDQIPAILAEAAKQSDARIASEIAKHQGRPHAGAVTHRELTLIMGPIQKQLNRIEGKLEKK